LDKAVEYLKKAREIKADDNISSILVRLTQKQTEQKKFLNKTN